MKVIFMLPNGMVEWSVPQTAQADFNFSALVTNTRANGFFFDGNSFYVRHDLLVGMMLTTEDKPPGVIRKDLQ
jgi:hypothetical protein